MTEYEVTERRPIRSRDLGWVQRVAGWLVKRKVSANAISAASVVFGVGAAVAILLAGRGEGLSQRSLWLAAAVLVQFRLLCNLFDGMVAIEAGEASAFGELFNEVPDRISDAAVLVALGLVPGGSVHLGYSAAILAVFVAYVRAVGSGAGVGQVFDGWMAKPQRMALVTCLCLFLAIAPGSWTILGLAEGPGWPALVLAVICAGCVVTAWTRLSRIATRLRTQA